MGGFVVWRANTSNISFDNLRVTGSPASYNTLVYLHGDHLGSIGTVTNSSGALLDMTRFLPFGGFRGSDPAFLTERAFTGHKANNTSSNDLGLIYMNARYYVGSIGRFASADTLIPDPTNPQSFNRYVYVLNRPLSLIDPTGHWYYDPACDCLVDTSESYNEHPSNLTIPSAESITDDDCSVQCWLMWETLPELRFDDALTGIAEGLDNLLNSTSFGRNVIEYSTQLNGYLDQAGLCLNCDMARCAQVNASGGMCLMDIVPLGDYYRGGPSLTPKPNEVRIDPRTGLLKPTHGVSLFDDPAMVERFGGALR